MAILRLYFSKCLIFPPFTLSKVCIIFSVLLSTTFCNVGLPSMVRLVFAPVVMLCNTIVTEVNVVSISNATIRLKLLKFVLKESKSWSDQVWVNCLPKSFKSAKWLNEKGTVYRSKRFQHQTSQLTAYVKCKQSVSYKKKLSHLSCCIHCSHSESKTLGGDKSSCASEKMLKEY